MQDFKNLKVWQKAHLLTVDVFRATSAFPREELYGLTSQMRRASISIPSNIAEGCGRGGRIELGHFLRIALGSASELEYQLILAAELGFLISDDFVKLSAQVDEVKRMLSGLIRKTRQLNAED